MLSGRRRRLRGAIDDPLHAIVNLARLVQQLTDSLGRSCTRPRS